MSTLSDLIDTAGDELKEQAKTQLLELIQGAKEDVNDLIKESGKEVEKWLVQVKQEKMDSDELDALLRAQRRKLEQYINTGKIKASARAEELTIGLVDYIVDKVIGTIV